LKKALIAIILLTFGCASVKVMHTRENTVLSFVTKAENIVFYGSHNGFEPLKAEQNGNRWDVTIKPVSEIKYFLKADGKVFLPDCRMKEKDDFGSEICIYER